MAKKKIKVKALVNIKYDKECIEINKDFSIRESDLKVMLDNGYVEALEQVDTEEPNDEPIDDEE